MPSRSSRGEATRSAISAAATELFLERGYDRTTMRAVADRAGVSLGNAYYYFASKEHLVQAFYDDIQVQHAARVAPALGRTAVFADRLSAALLTWVDVAAPYHAFAGQFFKVAADPASPLSPFSGESGPAREASLATYRSVVEGSDVKVTRDLRAELPELLWLLQMGVVLHWVHDRTDGQAATRELVARVVPLVDKVVRLTRLPGVKSVVADVIALVQALHPNPAS